MVQVYKIQWSFPLTMWLSSTLNGSAWSSLPACLNALWAIAAYTQCRVWPWSLGAALQAVVLTSCNPWGSTLLALCTPCLGSNQWKVSPNLSLVWCFPFFSTGLSLFPLCPSTDLFHPFSYILSSLFPFPFHEIYPQNLAVPGNS